MRLRNIPGAREEMLVNPYVVQNPEKNRGCWREWFSGKTGKTEAGKSLYLEIGTGKGKFLTELAKENAENLYLGIEKYSSVLIKALAKQEALALPNLFFIRMEAERMEEIFAEEEIDGIYLNFSDPWPKERNAKRRLTSPNFLTRYKNVLKKNAKIEFKTDNEELFRYSLQSAEECGFEIEAATFDLYRDEKMAEGNIMTEYEERFLAENHPICKMILVYSV